MSEGYMMPGDREALDTIYVHKPLAQGQVDRINEINAMSAALSAVILRLCPPSRERVTALACIETAALWSTEAIRRNEVVARNLSSAPIIRGEDRPAENATG